MIKCANKPELLSPAGSREALRAAVSAGCDAVYLGMKEFSARAFAKNFENDDIQKEIEYCHLFGVKVYVAINNQIYEKELPSAVGQILSLHDKGADGFIVSNTGLARYISKRYPDIVLHASTQATGVNFDSSEFLKEIGFSRMVVPREISLNDLKILAEKSEIELEMFIHGALCVSFSGQCLLSSIIGGRSGNRGECAQPCRMEYENGKYPLSLKDLNLAAHMTELLDLGISSFKIEGRMKSPAYVYTVTKIYRKLIDERRNATKEELDELNTVFSRSGSTDGYLKGKIDRSMTGIRKKEDKSKTEQFEKSLVIEEKKIPVTIECELQKNKNAHIKGTAKINGEIVTKEYYGDICEESKTYPLTKEIVEKQISKLGNTNFILSSETSVFSVEDGINMPISSLNALRRGIVEELEKVVHKEYVPVTDILKIIHVLFEHKNMKIAIFVNADNITEKSYEYFDRIYVKVYDFKKIANSNNIDKIGIIYPPYYFDTEKKYFEKLISDAKNLGCKYSIVSNASQINNAKENGFDIILSYRFNIYNTLDVQTYSEFGIKNYICSNELNLEQMKTLSCAGEKYALVYGRIPLMTLHKCAVKEIRNISDSECSLCGDGQFFNLKDSTKAVFKIYGCGSKYKHRNILFNSVPVWMADKYSLIEKAKLDSLFVFSDESKNEVDSVIEGYKTGKELKNGFRRIKND